MSGSPLTGFLHRFLDREALRALPDAQLVERFVAQRDQSAFALLVERHGGTVLGVARQVLRDWHAAEDVFQATFLTLARKARTLRAGRAVRSWLYETAVNLSRTVRTAAARRQAHERRAAREPMSDHEPTPTLDDFRAVVHEEIGRLPERYRLPLLLCHLDGLTHDAAAAELGCPVGTVRSRLSRARDLLRARLERRGVTAATLALGMLSEPGAKAAVPAALTAATSRAAASVGANPAVAPAGVSSAVWALAQGAGRGGAARLKALVAVVLTLGTACVGVVVAGELPDRDPPRAMAAAEPVRAAAPGPGTDTEITVTPVLGSRYTPPRECVNLDWVDDPPPGVKGGDCVSFGYCLVVQDGELWAYINMWVGVQAPPAPKPGDRNYRAREQGFLAYRPPPGLRVVGFGAGQGKTQVQSFLKYRGLEWNYASGQMKPTGPRAIAVKNLVRDLNEFDPVSGTRWDRFRAYPGDVMRGYRVSGDPTVWDDEANRLGIHFTFNPVRVVVRSVGSDGGGTRTVRATASDSP